MIVVEVGLVIVIWAARKASVVVGQEERWSLKMLMFCWKQDVNGAPTQNANTLGEVVAMC